MEDGDVTFLSGLGDDISSRFTHHLGYVKWAVRLFGDGDGPIYRLCLHLQQCQFNIKPPLSGCLFLYVCLQASVPPQDEIKCALQVQ